jgi:hypothetical protein
VGSQERLDGRPQCGIVTAGVIEIRVPRWPIKGGCRGEHAADVGPSIGIDVEAFFHFVTLPIVRVSAAPMATFFMLLTSSRTRRISAP